jgi:hypothetical protein
LASENGHTAVVEILNSNLKSHPSHPHKKIKRY